MGYAFIAADLLNVWERGCSQSSVDRALSLLALAEPGSPSESLAQWSVGRRDAELLKLRERIFGSLVTGQADCPACSEQVELNLTIGDIRAELPAETQDVFTLQTDGHELRFRLPNSLDLAELSYPPVADSSVLERGLLQRCLLSARCNEREVAACELPTDVVQTISQKMAEGDPQSDVQLALDCPHCSHHWRAPFDIGSFLWSELHAWAVRLLRDVHALASAYSWDEADILAMPSGRRQAYLELIEQ
jgi:hypothetical protein